MVRLSVNVNKVATLRNSRGGAEPSVLELIDHNPFENEPPKQVRALIYRYEFTTYDEREATGQWWARRDRALYAPILGVKIKPPAAPDATPDAN